VCRYWQLALPDATVMDRAVLLAHELVTNAVAHARTEIRLRLELRGDRLHIAVRDGSPGLLRLVTPDWQAEGGPGGGWLSSSPAPGGQPSSQRRQGRVVRPQPVSRNRSSRELLEIACVRQTQGGNG
jgi:two-component sensor histidine kinase